MNKTNKTKGAGTFRSFPPKNMTDKKKETTNVVVEETPSISGQVPDEMFGEDQEEIVAASEDGIQEEEHSITPENKELSQEEMRRLQAAKKRAMEQSKGQDPEEKAKKKKMFSHLIKEKQVVKRKVQALRKDPELGDIMIVNVEGTKGYIPIQEADADITWKSLINFAGKQVTFIATHYDEESDILTCSRKQAQQIAKSALINKIKSGQAINVTIVHLTYFGAYVETKAGVTGILKNEAFSDEHVNVGDIFNVGDELPVILQSVNKEGKIFFEAPTKYKKSEIPEIILS